MSTASHPARLLSVQVLRGVAALLVVFYHIYELQRLALTAPGAPAGAANDIDMMSGFWMRGYAGVDLFFVISGFIMVYITAGLAPNWRESVKFLRNRAVRVYPLWWVFCAILTVYYMMSFGVPYSPDAVANDTQIVPYLLKSAFLIPQTDFPILGVGWTLIHEVFFYMVFAVLLLTAFKFRILALMLWAGLVIAAAMLGWTRATVDSFAVLSISLFTLEFIAGALAAALIVKGKIIAPKVCFWLGAAGAVLALCFYTEGDFTALSSGRVMVFTLPFAVLIYGWTGIEIRKPLRLWKPLVWLGNVSYSLYLSHILVLGVIIRLLPRLPVPQLGESGLTDNLIFTALGLAASLSCAALFYYGAERPLLRVMRRRKTRPVS